MAAQDEGGGWVPFGNPTRPSSVVIEEPIEIQWTDPVRRGRRQPSTSSEPEPEPERAAVWSDEDGGEEGEQAGTAWQGQHPAISGAALGEVLARAEDTRSLEQIQFPAQGAAREVVEWLGRAGLAAYAQALVGAGLTSMEHCAVVTPEDLAAAGMAEPEMETFYAALRERGSAEAPTGEEPEQGAVLSTTMADQRDQLLQLLPESMRALYTERTLAANVASMSQPASAPPLERAEGLPSAAELEAAAARPSDLWADAEPAQWDVDDATPAKWDDDEVEGESAAAAEERRKQAAFADEDDSADEEIDEEAVQAEIARLQAEVDRWQQKVAELADAGDVKSLERMRASLFGDADSDSPGRSSMGSDIDVAVDAMSAAQAAMQQRLGKLSERQGSEAAKSAGSNKAPPMLVMRPMSGPE